MRPPLARHTSGTAGETGVARRNPCKHRPGVLRWDERFHLGDGSDVGDRFGDASILPIAGGGPPGCDDCDRSRTRAIAPGCCPSQSRKQAELASAGNATNLDNRSWA